MEQAPRLDSATATALFNWRIPQDTSSITLPPPSVYTAVSSVLLQIPLWTVSSGLKRFSKRFIRMVNDILSS